MGHDFGFHASTSRNAQFQSTCPCGARPPTQNPDSGQCPFQSMCPCGARRYRAAGRRSGMESFNPRAHAGHDPSQVVKGRVTFLFQSTRPCGARRRLLFATTSPSMFQSTCPCGARLPVSRYMPALAKSEDLRQRSANRIPVMLILANFEKMISISNG